MADLQQFAVTATGQPVTLSLPGWTLAAQMTNSASGALIKDFTGVNAVAFPAVLGTLTTAQQQAFITSIASSLLMLLSGA